MKELLAIGLAGALGSVARYAVSGLAARWWGESFPWGTLTVNALGALVLGFVAGFAMVSDGLPPSVRIPIATGFLGAFTTFSTFSVETIRLAEKEPWLALGNVLVSILLGLVLAAAGLAAGRWAAG